MTHNHSGVLYADLPDAGFTARNVTRQLAFLMPAVTLVPAAEAAVFTLGCALIHAQRRHAERLTKVLAMVAIIALLTTASLAVPEEELNKAALGAAMSELGATLPLPSE
ncbi:hypothetical protein ACU4GR_01020 [Methylobacterium oryzae CBMB20]